MTRKGFTLIELLAVIVILGIILLISMPIIFDLINNVKKDAFIKSSEGIVSAARLKYTSGILKDDFESVTFTYIDGIEQSNPSGVKLNYSGEKPESGVVIVDNNGDIAIALYDGTYCTTKSFESSRVIMEELDEVDCTIELPLQPFDYSKGVNRPKIADGLTPIKWDGNNWIDTTESDTGWYDYDNKQWANAKSNDGSFWVWIPRYAYSITSGYHTSTAGEVDIKFLIDDTVSNLDGTVVETSGYEVGVKDTSNNYFLHPAFTFGTDELTGFWMAKFEASNDSDNIKIVPNASSWRNINVNDMFQVSYDMKNNLVYGWNSGEIDTHLIKEIEWGAVAYMSASQYGKTGEVWTNPSSNYITGCAGTGISVVESLGCDFTYETENGVNASTSGTLYGVYDMAGGAYEYVSAYLNNNDSSLTIYGDNAYTSDLKYKDVYQEGINDLRQENYLANKNYYGNAKYEVSVDGESPFSWNGDYSHFPQTINPWIIRGGSKSHPSNAGIWYSNSISGIEGSGGSFRPVLVLP